MGKLGVFSDKEVCGILEKNGFLQVRQKGSHLVMQLRKDGKTITFPVPDHRELKIGTLVSTIHQSRVPRSEFENL